MLSPLFICFPSSFFFFFLNPPAEYIVKGTLQPWPLETKTHWTNTIEVDAMKWNDFLQIQIFQMISVFLSSSSFRSQMMGETNWKECAEHVRVASMALGRNCSSCAARVLGHKPNTQTGCLSVFTSCLKMRGPILWGKVPELPGTIQFTSSYSFWRWPQALNFCFTKDLVGSSCRRPRSARSFKTMLSALPNFEHDMFTPMVNENSRNQVKTLQAKTTPKVGSWCVSHILKTL